MRKFGVVLSAAFIAVCVAAALIAATAAAEPAKETQAAAERTMHELERIRDNPLALQ
jgi:hypothetical protein